MCFVARYMPSDGMLCILIKIICEFFYIYISSKMLFSNTISVKWPVMNNHYSKV